MFPKKHDVRVGAQTFLKNKAARQLRSRMGQAFASASDAPAAEAWWDGLVGSKPKLWQAKLPNKIVVYGVDREDGGAGAGAFAAKLPLLIDDERQRRLLPTLQLLWAWQEAADAAPLNVPVIEVPSAVSAFLLRGADLMAPGIQRLPPFAAGALVAVAVRGNPACVAVGVAVQSSDALQAAGMTGRAVEVLFRYRDALWEECGRPVPNEGFEQTIVLPTDGRGDNDSEEEGEEEEEEEAGEEGGQSAGGEAGPAAAGAAAGGGGAEAGSAAEVATDRIWSTLLQALSYLSNKKDMPMPASVLWSQHLLPRRRAGWTLDIKTSAFKKVSDLLQAAKERNLIQTSEPQPGVLVVQQLNPAHPDLKAHRRWPEEEEAGAAKRAGSLPLGMRSRVLVQASRRVEASAEQAVLLAVALGAALRTGGASLCGAVTIATSKPKRRAATFGVGELQERHDQLLAAAAQAAECLLATGPGAAVSTNPVGGAEAEDEEGAASASPLEALVSLVGVLCSAQRQRLLQVTDLREVGRAFLAACPPAPSKKHFVCPRAVALTVTGKPPQLSPADMVNDVILPVLRGSLLAVVSGQAAGGEAAAFPRLGGQPASADGGEQDRRPQGMLVAKKDWLKAVEGFGVKATLLRLATGDYQLVTGGMKLPKIAMATATVTGTKCVTLVRGLESFGISLEEAKAQSRSLFAGAASIQPSRLGNCMELMIQGDCRKRLAAFLAEQGVPADCMDGVTGGKRGKGPKSRR